MAEETMRIVVEQIGASVDSSGASSFSTTTDSSSGSSDKEEASDEGMSKFDMALMRAGPELLAFKKGLEIVVEAFNVVKASALDFAQKIESVAPNIQAANAQRDVRMNEAMLNADERAGPQISALIEAQAKSDANLIRIDATLNKWGAAIVEPFESFRSAVLDGIANVLESTDKVVSDLVIDFRDSLVVATGHATKEIQEEYRRRQQDAALAALSVATTVGLGGVIRHNPMGPGPWMDVQQPTDKSGGAFGIGV